MLLFDLSSFFWVTIFSNEWSSSFSVSFLPPKSLIISASVLQDQVLTDEETQLIRKIFDPASERTALIECAESESLH